MAGGGAVEEELGEQRDVLDALAQGRHRHRHHVQAIEEILAEAPGGHLGPQVAVGGRHDAHVGLALTRGAERA
jgi:hypothetical protein